jgi:predicted PurR-regulated permease PerM
MTIVAFISLGLLIGNIVGMTESVISNTLIGLLFAFGGTTAIGFLRKVRPSERKIAACCIISLSFSCLVGLYMGIYVSRHQLLGPSANKEGQSLTYLRKSDIEKIDFINIKKKENLLSCEDAYEELYSAVKGTDSDTN